MRQLQLQVKDRDTDWLQFGQVNARYSGDLVLFNYRREAEFENRWNWFERNARGLILNWMTGEVVAWPFSKFWNWNQGGRKAFGHIVTITEKLDGSLGIFYRRDEYRAIATRGSFISDQALWATEFLNEHWRDVEIPDEYTLLFEIIYPDNRIVVDYEGREDLVLLAIRNRFTGDYLPFYPDVYEFAQKWGFSTPRVFDFNNVTDIIAATDYLSTNEEGFVVEFADGKRFKFKGDAYVELHRAISGLSFKRVLQAIQNGTYLEMLKVLPIDFQVQVHEWHDEIETTVRETERQVDIEFGEAPKESRKDFALWARANAEEWMPYLFARLDGRDTRDMILKKEFKRKGEKYGSV
jgi:RNA ligase